MEENDLSYQIIETALELHKNVGPGLLESTYKNALPYDLREVGLEVKQQVPMPFVYMKIRIKLSHLKLGSLINFNCKLWKEGIHRVVNNV